MQRVSSRWTWWHKKAFPALWFGGLGFFTLFGIGAVAQQRAPAILVMVPLGMMAFGYALMSTLIFPLADEVYLSDDQMIVRKGGDEDSFPIANIISASASAFTSPERVKLTLREPCRFGLEVVFCPLIWWPFSHHPLVKELIQRANGISPDDLHHWNQT